MAGWWDGVGKAIEIVTTLTRSRRAGPDDDVALQPRGVLGGLEARLAGVLVSALQEAFARDAARLDVEREHAEAERRRAEAALRLELARQEADRQAGLLRMAIAIDIVVWLASLLVMTLHPPQARLAMVLLGCAWTALTAAVALAFAAHAGISAWAVVALHLPEAATRVSPRHRFVAAASWLTVCGLGLTAATVIASLV